MEPMDHEAEAMMKTSKRRVALHPLGMALVVVLGLAVLAPPAQATVITKGCANENVSCTMAEFLAGGTMQIDDKIFHEFQDYSSIGTGGASPVNAANITILPVGEGTLQMGLRYQSADFLVVFGQTQDTLFNYVVETLDGSDKITDNKLIGDNFTAANGGTIFISENVVNEDGDEVAQKEIFDLDGRSSFVQRFFDAQDFVRVSKDIALNCENTENTACFAFVSDFRQEFSQIPQPTSLLLLGLGLSGVVGLAWRRRT